MTCIVIGQGQGGIGSTLYNNLTGYLFFIIYQAGITLKPHNQIRAPLKPQNHIIITQTYPQQNTYCNGGNVPGKEGKQLRSTLSINRGDFTLNCIVTTKGFGRSGLVLYNYLTGFLFFIVYHIGITLKPHNHKISMKSA